MSQVFKIVIREAGESDVIVELVVSDAETASLREYLKRYGGGEFSSGQPMYSCGQTWNCELSP